ncbi:MAG: right-handed parallel beta-helix repeat-containing protein [Phenylobacterium sp.]|uniref:parallel beta-helix domain-containing protein n=1 Tax=Phenylobacterium sp. TaxID=1871053 RepID=UPI0025DBE6BF|nr:parallel beta-helix domain-containing protein [Phenylobacterium sp.]MCA3722510.1 right-handed parallel beta-helix repeat-containing protein [Phenylobacterium sp.]MCA3732081.1 right-handed parallel beta-helix repeat-containing protein [Phenylobacterium sp.]MCA6243309.1 right-handed parallel beta-helix repeat-containing protein [Phenylobacterium sp.]MCA6276506.1 right-handed parallel beta-helix repeat-containing protein [Phenylobacterium sp.]MCA6294941.1 right-handed parallel beta-helix repea
MSRITARLAVVAGLAAACGTAQAATLTVTPGPDAQERLQTALLDAKPGDTVQIAAGRYDLTDGLSLDVDGVTLAGAGPGATVLSFRGQKGAGEGLLITSDRVTVKDLAVEDTRGDGIKSKGADDIRYLNLRVEWTGGPKETNGAYGVYPVASERVLIDRVVVKGASDAGIYVGQSKHIVVRNSRAEFNVAGIEIENSMFADVHDNVATRNAGGILVFDLPNLPQMGGHSTRVFRNRVVDNDTPNFAPKGNIVAGVPTGTGVMVMANRNVHVFENEISGNQSAGVLLVSYTQAFNDPIYNPLPRDIVVRANRIGRNGWDPKLPGGPEIARALGGPLPPVVWDGVRAAGGRPAEVRVNLADGPVLNLNLPGPGRMDAAAPTVAATISDAAIAEPPAVSLDAAGK